MEQGLVAESQIEWVRLTLNFSDCHSPTLKADRNNSPYKNKCDCLACIILFIFKEIICTSKL